MRNFPSAIHRAVVSFLVAFGLSVCAGATPPGVVVTWGPNWSGGTNTPKDLTNIVHVSAAYPHMLALRADGTVAGWGIGDSGKLDVPAGLKDVVSITAGGYVNFAVKQDGTVVWWGDISKVATNAPANLTNVVKIASQPNATYALLADGRLLGWGTRDADPSLLNIPNVAGGFKDIACGTFATLAISSSGKLYAWGTDTDDWFTHKPYRLNQVPDGLSVATLIAADGALQAGVTPAGKVIPWGYSFYGELLVPEGLTGVKALAVNQLSLAAITSSNTVVTWGMTRSYPPPPWLQGVVGICVEENDIYAITTAPVLRSGPMDLVALSGTSPQFTVFAQSATPLTYQWSYAGTNLVGETNSSLVLPKVATVQAGQYAVQIGNGTEYSVTASAHLTVNAAPTFTQQPQSKSAPAGSDVLFSASLLADGEPTTLLWKRTGSNSNLATGNALSLPNVQLGDAGTYFLQASNRLGPALSEPATLTVTPSSPAFTITPANQSLKAGSTLTMASLARGSEPINYQWYRDGTPVEGAIGALLTLINVQTDRAGGYSVLASNAVGTSMSSTAQVQITASAPFFTLQPKNTSIAAGNDTQLVAAAAGSLPIALQWRHNGTNLPGANQPTLSFGNVQSPNAGPYLLTASNAFGIVESQTVQLIVFSSPPTFTQRPIGGSVHLGEDFLFSAAAKGSEPINFQWQLNINNLIGATNPVLAVRDVDATKVGSYRVIISNPYGSAISTQVVLNGLFPPVIQTQPQSLTIAELAGKATFSVSMAGGTNLAFQWYFKGGLIPDATASSLLLAVPKFEDSGPYRVVITNIYGSVTSSVATLLVLPSPPVITRQPFTRGSPHLGEPLVVEVAASSLSPLRYQWQLDGREIPKATNAIYQNGSFSTEAAGEYRVRIQNSAGSVLSEPVRAGILLGTEVAIEIPHNQKAFPGSTVTFTGKFKGSPSYSYAWYLDGQPLAGQTNSTLTLTNVQAADSGSYSVRIQSSQGIYNLPGRLTVYQPGRLVGWDANDFGQLNFPLSATNVVDISAAGSNSLALTLDKKVVFWGPNADGKLTPPVGLGNIIAIAAGPTHALALQEDGHVVAWGRSSTNGELGVPSGLDNVVGIAAALNRSIALKSDGTVVSWGREIPPPSTNQILTNIATISAGANFNLALKRDGKLIVWGDPYYGTPDPGRVVLAAAAPNFGMFIDDKGIVGEWGMENLPPPSDYNNSIAVAGGMKHLLGLHADGTVNEMGPIEVIQRVYLTNALVTAYAIAAGFSHSLAITLPVLITLHPANLTLEPGVSATFAVDAKSSSPIAYQWQRDGVAIPNATNKTLIRTNVSTLDNGSYQAVIRAEGATTFSRVATLKVNGVPELSKAPADTSVSAGRLLNLNVGVTGPPPLSFQWSRDGINLPGETNSTLIRSNAQAGDAGSYVFRAANNYGASLTIPIQVTVTPSLPAITAFATATNLLAGDSVDLIASVVGTEPISIFWSRDSAPIPGATNAALHLSQVQPRDSGHYSVTAGNSVGGSSVRVVDLQVAAAPPRIVSAPASTNVLENSSATFQVAATGSLPLYYQWSKNGADLPGQNSSILSLTNLSINDAGPYTVIVSNLFGSVTSQTTYLKVRKQPLVGFPIAWPTGDISARAGAIDSTRATMIAGDDSFQALLLENGQVTAPGLSRLDGSVGYITITNDFRDVVHIAAGSSNMLAVDTSGRVLGFGTSASGQLNIPAKLGFSTMVAEGAFHALALQADGKVIGWGNNLSGQASPPNGLTNATAISAGLLHSLALTADDKVVAWGDNSASQLDIPINLGDVIAIAAGHYHNLALRTDGTVISWGNGSGKLPVGISNVIQISAGASSSMALRADGSMIAWNLAGNLVPLPANLRFGVAIALSSTYSRALVRGPMIVENPFSRTLQVLAPSTSSSNRVNAVGLAPLSYQWVHNNEPVPGATNAGIIFSPTVHFSDAGNYQVVVSNPYASVTSAIATITVTGPPTVTVDSDGSAFVAISSNVTLRGNAQSGTPVRLQWYFNARSIPNATNSTLVITNAQTTNSGSYALSANNSSGTTLSSPYSLYVIEAATIIQQPLSVAVSPGANAVFSVLAGGTPPFNYQWYRSNTALPFATGATLVISNVQSGNLGDYFVVVANGVKAVPSLLATLRLRDGLKITSGQMLSGGLFHLILEGVTAGTYEIDASTDLITWKKLTTAVIAEGHFDFVDFESIGASRRFYRLKLIP